MKVPIIYRSVLELGAGVGLLGLNCLRKYDPQRYIFTDCHQLVLDQCKRNLDHNQMISNGSEKEVKVANLDWMFPQDCDLWNRDGSLEINLILASGRFLFSSLSLFLKLIDLNIKKIKDIIFDPDLMPHLIQTLTLIWQKASKKTDDLKLIISSTIRNENTYDVFLQNLSSQEFSFVELDKNMVPLNDTQLKNSHECVVEILEIKKSSKN